MAENLNNQNEEKNQENDNKYVKVEKNKLDFILERLSTLEKNASEGTMLNLKPAKKHTARMRLFMDNFVIGFKTKDWSVYNKDERKEELWSTIILYKDGKYTDKKVKRDEMLEQSEQVDVEIISQVTEMKETNQGKVSIKEVQDFRTIESDAVVPAIISTPITTVKIKLPTDEVLDLPVDALNL